MGNYRNFRLAAYLFAPGAAAETREHLRAGLQFYRKYMRLDKIYLEQFRHGVQASPEQFDMCRDELERAGLEVAGGITTIMPTPPGDGEKARLFDVLCYNDEKMLAALAEASAFLAARFDEFIIDDFFFTNCTCDACRAERDLFNAAHGTTGFSAYRLDLMRRVSRDYMIAPAKRVNPNCRVIIKYPNWAESYQETGYNPAEQRDLFDGIYTGTETRDMLHTDQNLPRYLSYSLMTYFEAMSPGRNGGGWFDPYDMHSLDQYLEQAYLTLFSKPRELALFSYNTLMDRHEVAALGFHLDHLDDALDHLGAPVGVPCYLPDNSQGEDNAQDFLGMAGFPITLTPYFPKDAPSLFLTRAASCDPDIMEKLDRYVACGGKAIVTGGFVRAMLGRGIENMTSLRFEGRRASSRDYMVERTDRSRPRMEYVHGRDEIDFPVMEMRNNATWALVKAADGGESYALLARDTYGRGEMWTINLPDSYSQLRRVPAAALSRMRAEMPVNGVWLEGGEGVSIFHYDNGAFILYAYVQDGAECGEAFIHVQGRAKALTLPAEGKLARPDLPERRLEPLPDSEDAQYRAASDETVFRIDYRPGEYHVYRVER